MSKPLDQNQLYYQQYFKFPGRSQWMEKIWSEAFGDNYPVGIDHFGYLTNHDLEIMTRWLDSSPGDTMLDIGCGKGGPGLRLAEQLDLQLTGIDIVPEAVEQANLFASSFDLKYPATFKVGEFYGIPLPEQCMNSVISIDSLWSVPDKIIALKIIKRVMKPGAKLIFTHWDMLAQDPIPLLEDSGLKFIQREDTPNWKSYQQKVYEGITKYQGELVEEMGDGATMFLHEAKTSPPFLDLSVRRIYHFENR